MPGILNYRLRLFKRVVAEECSRRYGQSFVLSPPERSGEILDRFRRSGINGLNDRHPAFAIGFRQLQRSLGRLRRLFGKPKAAAGIAGSQIVLNEVFEAFRDGFFRALNPPEDFIGRPGFLSMIDKEAKNLQSLDALNVRGEEAKEMFG
jgi:hypothetical protein